MVLEIGILWKFGHMELNRRELSKAQGVSTVFKKEFALRQGNKSYHDEFLPSARIE